MDVAKHFLRWKERPPEELARAANRYLPSVVCALLIIVLAGKLAELTWVLIPGTRCSRRAPICLRGESGLDRAAPTLAARNEGYEGKSR